MTKMRNGWEDDVRINSLQHEASISRPQLTNIPAAEKSESLYDFGISTNRPISAPLPSGIGLDVSFITYSFHQELYHFYVGFSLTSLGFDASFLAFERA